MAINKKNIKNNCPFCANKLDQLGLAIFKCNKCESNYHLASASNIPTQIISFDTERYSVQIYNTGKQYLTRVNVKNKRQVLFWLKEKLNINNYSLEALDQRIYKLIMLS